MGWLGACVAHLVRARSIEVLLLQGAPVLGALFALGSPAELQPARTALFALGSLSLVAFVFLFNDWADLRLDSTTPDKTSAVFTRRGIAPRQMLLFALALGAISMGALAAVSPTALALGAGVAVAGGLYSWPAGGTKGVPLVSSVSHLAGQGLQFLLGYTLFASLDQRGLLIAPFFALVFAGGHLNQEVRDHDGDRDGGVRTNAVTFGKRPAFLASHVLLTGSFLYLIWLATTGIVPREMSFLAGLYPVYSVVFWRTFAGELGSADVVRLQLVYRGVYAAVGLGMVASLAARLAGSPVSV